MIEIIIQKFRSKYIIQTISLLLAVISLYLWYHKGVQGLGISTLPIPEKPSWYENISFFCKDLPVCFRPVTGWIVLSFNKFIVIPFLMVFDSSLLKTQIPLTLSSTITLSACYLCTFLIYTKIFPGLWGYLALVSFSIVPYRANFGNIGWIGLSKYDPVVLLFWSLMIYLGTFIIRNLTESHFSYIEKTNHRTNKFVNKNIFKNILPMKSLNKVSLCGFIIGLFSTLIMENTGIAIVVGVSIITLLLYLMKIKNSGINFVIFVAIGVIVSLGLAWIMTHRHADVFWAHPGQNIGYMWELYGRNNTWDLIRSNVVAMATPGIKVSYIVFFLTLLFSEKLGKIDSIYLYSVIIVSISLFLGFVSTLIVGRFVSNFLSEWPRQLLPISLFSSYIFCAIALIIGSSVRRYIVTFKNTLFIK